MIDASDVPDELILTSELNETFTMPSETCFVTDEPTCATEFIEETISVAEAVVDGFSVWIGDQNACYWLCDGNHYSRKGIRSDTPLSFTSDTPFSALYFEWNQLPGIYTIRWDTGSMRCGEEGFLHDYVTLPEPVTAAVVEFETDAIISLCDVFAFTEGSAPEGIQDWQLPCDEADILVFPTHSDDDTIFFGAMIAHYAIEKKLTVQTAFMVDHGSPERNHERLDGLWELGIRHYPVIGSAPDTDLYKIYDALHFYSSVDILGWQVEQIRRFKPLVVVGHDVEGEYGNGGHKVNSYYLVDAVPMAADETKYPELASQYGTWDTPKFYLHLYAEGNISLDVDSPLENDPEHRSAFEIAEDAYSNHVSQLHLPYKVRKGSEWPAYDCSSFGLYRSLVGEDSCADLMENINEQDWR